MSVYERLTMSKTPKRVLHPASKTSTNIQRRPRTTVAASATPAAPIQATNASAQKPSLEWSIQIQRSVRRIKSVGGINSTGRPKRATSALYPNATAGALPESAPVGRPDTTANPNTAAVAALARAIEDADYILIGTGAGFSADSGLAVYRDIARIPAYDLMGVDYASLCDPIWLKRNPDVFYGFWGNCYNSYRDTTPHQGYTIIKNMVLAYPNKRFFVYSSNVDSHFEKIGIQRKMLFEFHGTCMDWQCSRSCREDAIYRLPFNYRFLVNRQTMRCPNMSSSSPSTSPQIPRPLPTLASRTHRPDGKGSIFSDLYSSYYGNGSTAGSTEPAASAPASVPNTARAATCMPATPAVSKEVYNRVYSQDSSRPKSKGALHDALAKQGIDYDLIKNMARQMCSSPHTNLAAAATVMSGAETAPSCSNAGGADGTATRDKDATKEPVAMPARQAKDGSSLSAATPGAALRANDDAAAVEDVAADTKPDSTMIPAIPPSTVAAVTVTPLAPEAHKHNPRAIELNYRDTYEAARAITSVGSGAHPLCPWCKGYLRPRVLMFDDDLFMESTQEECRYSAFKKRMLKSKEKVCLLEIGCGLRIPTIRHEFEGILKSCAKRGMVCNMFRVNPGEKRARPVSHSFQAQMHCITQGGKETMTQLAKILGIPY